MRAISGLTPVETNRSERSQLRGRVQTADPSGLRPNQLQAVASPVDTFVRPSTPVEDNSLRDFAQALADVNPAIYNHLKQRESEVQDTGADALRVIQTTDPQVLADRIRNGDVPAEFQSLEGMRVFAENQAYTDSKELFRRYNEDFDRVGGDVHGLFAEVTADSFKRFGNDRAFNEVYTATMEKTRQRLFSSSDEYRTEQALTQRRDDVFTGWAQRVDFELAEGTPSGDIVTSLFADIPKNRDFLQLHPKEQQEMLLQIADQQATKGNYDVAKSILQTTRTDGAYSGNLMEDRDLGDKATTLFARIEADQLKQQQATTAAEDEAAVFAQADQMVLDGTILGVTDATVIGKDGEPKTISADMILERAANNQIEIIRQEAQARGATPEQARQWETERFVGSGLKHPVWFRSMGAAYTQMSTNSVTGENIPPTALEGFNTYRGLYTHSPQYVSKYLDSKAIDFYQTADLLMTSGLAASPEEALKRAQIATQLIDSNDPALNQRFADIDSAVSKLVGGSSWFSRNEASNNAQIRDTVARTAKLFARSGLANEEALKQATKLFENTHINVAGTYLRQDSRMPQDFSPLVESYIADFAAKYPEEGYEVGDLTIMELSNGTGGYYIADRVTRQPVMVEGGEMFFSFDTLTILRAQQRLDALNPVIEEQRDNQRANERANPLAPPDALGTSYPELASPQT